MDLYDSEVQSQGLKWPFAQLFCDNISTTFYNIYIMFLFFLFIFLSVLSFINKKRE